MADEPKKDKDIVRMQDLAAMVGTHFSDFLLVVRTTDGMAWKHSDPTWGVGACERYRNIMQDQSMLDLMDHRAGEGGE